MPTYDNAVVRNYLRLGNNRPCRLFCTALQSRARRREILNGLRILVVEDELLVALGLEEMLKSYGCEVVGPMPHLDNALQAARTEPLDGAILDVNLKGHPVYPVAEQLLSRGVPFIFCTGYTESSIVLKGFEHVPRLEKPYDEATLKAAMQREFLKPKPGGDTSDGVMSARTGPRVPLAGT